MVCKNFIHECCVNGYCPIALKNSEDELTSELANIAYSEINDCPQCYYNTLKCEDCIFNNTPTCDAMNLHKI